MISALASDQRFLRGLFLTGASHLMQHAQGLLLVVAFARWRSPVEFGAWTTVLVVATFLGVGALANLDSSATRFCSAKTDAHLAARRIRDILKLVALLAGSAALLTLALARPLAFLFRAPDLAPLILIGAALVAVHPIIMVCHAGLSAAERFATGAVVGMVGAVLTSVVVLWLLGTGAPVGTVVAAYALVQVVQAVTLTALLLRTFCEPNESHMRWRDHLAYSLPAFPVAIGLFVASAVDRLLIGSFLGLDDLGTYAAVFGITNILLIVPAPLGLVLFPRLVRLWHDGDTAKAGRYLGHTLSFLFVALLPASVGLVLVGGPFLATFVTGRVVVAGFGIVPWAVLSAALWALATPFLTMLKVLDRTREMGSIWVAVALAQLALGFVLIPVLGVVGAVVARAAMFGIALIAVVLAVARHLPVRIEIGVIARSVVATAVMVGVVLLVPISGPITLGVAIGGGASAYLVALVALEWRAPESEQVVARFLRPSYWLPGAATPE